MSRATVGAYGTATKDTAIVRLPTRISPRSGKRAASAFIPPPWMAPMTTAMATRIIAT